MKIKIDGTEYDFPTLDSVTLDEAIMLERHAGIGLEKLEPGDPLPVGAVKGLIIIAVRRARPDVTEREVAEHIGKLKLADLEGVFQDVGEGDADVDPPPALVDAMRNVLDESTERSGDPGSNGGEPTPAPSTVPPASGSPASATGQASVRAISAP